MENATKALTSPNRTRARLSSRIVDQFVAETLMVAFAVVVGREFGQGTPEVAFTEWDQTVQTFLLDRAHEPLRVRIAVHSLITEHFECGILLQRQQHVAVGKHPVALLN